MSNFSLLKTYHEVKIAPSEAHLLRVEAVAGANRICGLSGVFARLLVHFHTDKVKVEVTLHNALLKRFVEIGGPVCHLKLGNQFAQLKLIRIAQFSSVCHLVQKFLRYESPSSAKKSVGTI